MDKHAIDCLREMLESVLETGCSVMLRQWPHIGTRMLDLDADALRVLIAHYELRRVKTTRPAWLDPEPFDMPTPPRHLPEDLRE